MENNFPSTTSWDLSDSLEEITSWVPQLLRLPSTRELTILVFDIREIEKNMTRIDELRTGLDQKSSDEEEDDENENEGAPATVPPPIPSLLPTARPIRSTRGKTTTEDDENPKSNEVVVPLAATTLPTIRSKRAPRGTKVSEGADVSVDSVFPVKVRPFSIF
jgi:hypothetical protein